MPKKLSEREEQLICKQYEDNWTLSKISAYASVSKTTIMTVLRRNNIPLKCGKQISADQEEKVISLYNKGDSILSIMEITGVKSQQSIYRILRDYDVERRRNTEYGALGANVDFVK